LGSGAYHNCDFCLLRGINLANDHNLEGRVAIVTGASRGIGKAIALAMAQAGAAVVVAARTVEEGGPLKGTIFQTVKEIEAEGGRALAVKVDVTNEGQVKAMVANTLQEMGRIDILVNNAGGTIIRPFMELRLRHWEMVFKTVVLGTVACTKAVLPSMMEQRYGHIINISSVASITINEPFTGLAYDVSKAGVNRLTWGLAEEIKEYNIAVNALVPRNTTSEGWIFLHPDDDKSQWQKPEMWARIATFVATRDPATFTGRILTTEDAEQEMAKVGWTL